jgi:hypothetical protein
MKTTRLLILMLLSVVPVLAAPDTTPKPDCEKCDLAYLTIAFVDVLFVLTLGCVVASLRGSKGWSLASALAENIHWSPAPAAPAPVLGASGLNPGAASTSATSPAAGTAATASYESSASRLIAFVGMLAIVIVFVGASNWVIWVAFTTNGVPVTTELLKFIAGGAALFVPYAVNQARSALENSNSETKT